MANRSLVMLATEYNPLKFKVEASFLSEKLDGVRALWLPFTRGMMFSQIPWANRTRDTKEYVCSGLWSRRGKIFAAPDWFLDTLPKDVPLDGELFAGRNLFQQTVSVVRKHEPVNEEWQKISYRVFDIPSYEMFFRSGQIREGGKAGEPAYEVYFKSDWPNLFPGVRESKWWKPRRFSENVNYLLWNPWKDRAVVSEVPQIQIPATRLEAESVVQSTLASITEQGGEGLMLRRGHSLWEPLRSIDLVKVKKMQDSEAQVVGYIMGDGKYSNMIGALRLRWNVAGPKIFDLSGLTEREREIDLHRLNDCSEASAGTLISRDIGSHFPIGSMVSFLYNGVTDEGKPKFGRYWRKAELI